MALAWSLSFSLELSRAGWKRFVSVDDFSDLVMHETICQIKKAVYSLSVGLHFTNGEHKEKAAGEKMARLRSKESSEESHGRALDM